MAKMSMKELNKFLDNNPNTPAAKAVQEQLTEADESSRHSPEQEFDFHEIAEVYPLASDTEIQEMAQSIESQGQLHPIKLYEGRILDGRNRYKACRIAGREPQYEYWHGTYMEALEYVTAENEHRRHLTSGQKAACAILKDELVRKFAGEGKATQKASVPKKGQKGFQSSNVTQKVESHRNDRHDPNTPQDETGLKEHKSSRNERTTNAKLAKLTGTNRQYIEDIKRIRRTHPDRFEEIRTGQKSIPEIKKLLNAEQRENSRQDRMIKAQNVIIPDDIEIYQGDCLELSHTIEADTIDCIITDPPYPYEFIDCWSKLGEIGKRVLKPGGFCVAYTGVMYLPEVIERMGEHLEYFWTISLILSGPGSKAYARSVVNNYRPILVYVKPPAEQNIVKMRRTLFSDIIQGSGRQKDMHEWQQSEDELKYIFDTFTELHGTILDPFAGSGTVLAMAKNMNRHAIGFELEAENIDNIKVRVGQNES